VTETFSSSRQAQKIIGLHSSYHSGELRFLVKISAGLFFEAIWTIRTISQATAWQTVCQEKILCRFLSQYEGITELSTTALLSQSK
jgi:hypothetical protein